MTEICSTPGCTVGDTDICLLANEPNACPFRGEADDTLDDGPQAELAPPVLDAPPERPTLWGSLPLRLDEVRELMTERRCHIVGVVGTPAAGKTAALVSLYLLLAHGRLAGYQFADSRTLMALEEISQGARRWGPAPPDDMTARTEASDARAAGFLHVQLKRERDGRLVDFVVPDLPGEWSDALIDTNRTDRLAFLKSADVIWLFVNGNDLRQPEMRMLTLSRTRLLLRRVADLLPAPAPPLKIVVSHADLGGLPEKTVTAIRASCETAGIDSVEIVTIASFSADPAVPPGTGIATLIDGALPAPAAPAAGWPVFAAAGERFILRYSGADERP